MELRDRIRAGKEKCFKCDNKANTIHHKDGNHSNNDPENKLPACQKCHDKIHGITPQISEIGTLIRSYWDIQEFRKSVDSRIRSYKRIDYPVENFEEIAKDIRNMEKKIAKDIKNNVKSHIMYKEALKVKGLGVILTAGLISIIGDPRRFSNPSKIWKFFGLHTVNGEAVKRKRGQKLDFSVWRRSFAWKIGTCFNRNRNRSNIGKLLIQYHDFYKNRDGEKLSKGHILNRALRKTIKVFLACFWAQWMELLEEEPVSPYAHKLKEHTHLVKWSDLIE